MNSKSKIFREAEIRLKELFSKFARPAAGIDTNWIINIVQAKKEIQGLIDIFGQAPIRELMDKLRETLPPSGVLASEYVLNLEEPLDWFLRLDAAMRDVDLCSPQFPDKANIHSQSATLYLQ